MTLRRAYFLLLTLCVCLALITLPAPASAQGNPKLDPALLAKAQQQGQIALIVGLNMPFHPDAQLAPGAAQAQRTLIRQLQAQFATAVAGKNVTIRRSFTYIPYLSVETDAAGLSYLAGLPLVANLRENQRVSLALDESAPLIGADVAWGQGYEGTGYTVAVLDTGVENTHPFLAGKVVAEACYAPDCTAETGPDVALPCGAPDCLHGTHVSGIVAGKNATFSGVARDATIMAVRIFGLNAQNQIVSDDAYILSGLEYVYSQRSNFNIAAVNMSLAYVNTFHTATCDNEKPAITAIFATLRAANIAPVVASGNNALDPIFGSYQQDGIAIPACISHAVSVGASTKTDRVGSFSQSAPILSLLAPGVYINSSVLNGQYAEYSGTSMAAPHVAGAWAVLRERLPNASIGDILYLLRSTGVPLWDSRSRVNTPRIRLDRIVDGLNAGKDQRADALTVGLGRAVALHDISALTVSGDDPALCVPSRSNTAWYRFTAPTTSGMMIDTHGSQFDTVMGLYTSTMQPIACSNDTAFGNTAQIFFRATAGAEYYIQVARVGTSALSGPTYARLSITEAADLSNGFASDTENWRVSGDAVNGSPMFVASGGNPGGYISAEDAVANVVWYFHAPESYLGNRSMAYGRQIRFDLKQDSTSSQFNDSDVVLVGSGITLTYDTPNNPGTTWTSYSINLTESAGWKKSPGGATPTKAEFLSVLASLEAFAIRGEFGNFFFSADVGDLDNVSFQSALPNRPDTIGVFRPSSTRFLLRNQNTTGPADINFIFGGAADLPVAGDWNGDGTDTVGAYRPTTATFFLRDSNNGGPATYQFTLGNPGDVPMAGDWDGDGKDGVGVFRPTNGRTFLKNTLQTGFANYQMVFGIAGDQPLAGDWNGDGIDSPGLFRQANARFYLTDQVINGTPTASYVFVLGNPGDVPVAGDWNSDGRDGTGVFRPTNGITYLKNLLVTGFADVSMVYGIAGDRPIAGKWAAPTSAPQLSAPIFAPGR